MVGELCHITTAASLLLWLVPRLGGRGQEDQSGEAPNDGSGPREGCDWPSDSLALDSGSHRNRTEVKNKEKAACCSVVHAGPPLGGNLTIKELQQGKLRPRGCDSGQDASRHLQQCLRLSTAGG